ncbi:hypothetical protein D3C86_2077080 [compost metagenome]
MVGMVMGNNNGVNGFIADLAQRFNQGRASRCITGIDQNQPLGCFEYRDIDKGKTQ